MRYIDLEVAVNSVSAEVLEDLEQIDSALNTMTDVQKSTATSTARGNRHWSPAKAFLEARSNRKCWYTESKNPGCTNDVEHFRPKGKVIDKASGNIIHWYWFLAFKPSNYRISCQFSNRLNSNSVLGETGGKGDKFPLMPGSVHATDMIGIAAERPVILDPCCEADADLIEFQPDGRPVISPRRATDKDATYRVEQSKLLLNLDFPTFNEDRERLYNRVQKLVERGDRYAASGIDAIEDVQNDLRALMDLDSEYSKAAECYVRCFRDRGWVEDLIVA